MSSVVETSDVVSPPVVHSPERFDVLGVPVSAVDLDGAVATIEQWVRNGTKTYVCITGVHGVIESGKDFELRDIHRDAGLVTPDGMPLVWCAWSRGLRHVRRVYGPELMRLITRRAPQNRIRHYYYGGAAGVARDLQAQLEIEVPELITVGSYAPPFRPLSPEEDKTIVASINEAKPDILWVGLSTPKQEGWMKAHRHQLDVPVMIGVGAAFDFLSGRKSQAPLWMQRIGLEWLFRLLTEPRRLWKRYLTIIPVFVVRYAGWYISERIDQSRLR